MIKTNTPPVLFPKHCQHSTDFKHKTHSNTHCPALGSTSPSADRYELELYIMLCVYLGSRLCFEPTEIFLDILLFVFLSIYSIDFTLV